MKRYYTYILLCADQTYYVGVTNDVEQRFGEHQSGVGSIYTAGRLPVSLVFVMEFPTAEEAIHAEKQLKGWSRKKKEALIAGNYALLHQLARCRNVTSHENYNGIQRSNRPNRNASS